MSTTRLKGNLIITTNCVRHIHLTMRLVQHLVDAGIIVVADKDLPIDTFAPLPNHDLDTTQMSVVPFISHYDDPYGFIEWVEDWFQQVGKDFKHIIPKPVGIHLIYDFAKFSHKTLTNRHTITINCHQPSPVITPGQKVVFSRENLVDIGLFDREELMCADDFLRPTSQEKIVETIGSNALFGPSLESQLLKNDLVWSILQSASSKAALEPLVLKLVEVLDYTPIHWSDFEDYFAAAPISRTMALLFDIDINSVESPVLAATIDAFTTSRLGKELKQWSKY